MYKLTLILIFAFFAGNVFADDLLYRYEGDVLPYDESAGWINGNSCEDPCSESLENGHFVLRWERPADAVNYHLWIAQITDPPVDTLGGVAVQFQSSHRPQLFYL